MKIVSFNMAGSDKSRHAPSWFTVDHKQAVMKYMLRPMKAHIVVIQECVEMFTLEEYEKIQNLNTHCGALAVFVHKSVGSVSNVLRSRGLIRCTIELPLRMDIIALHLEAGSRCAGHRRRAIDKICKELPSSFVIIGDFNMRDKEAAEVEMALRATEAGPLVTFDTLNNDFHSNSPLFRCSFDRAFIKGLGVQSFTRVFDEKVLQDFYLSDHFGIQLVLDEGAKVLFH